MSQCHGHPSDTSRQSSGIVTAHECFAYRVTGRSQSYGGAWHADLGSFPNAKTLIEFEATGNATTVHFTTPSNWLLEWACDPNPGGVRNPFILVITDYPPPTLGHDLGTDDL